jgi:L-lactate dehydrogenase complex protein LldF
MSAFRDRARADIAAANPAATLTPIMRKLVEDSALLLGRGPADAKARAAAARAHAIANMEPLHARLKANFERRGIGYHRASTAADAVAIVRRLLGEARRVAKSKSMVGEEVGLTHALREAGIDVLETDIGEYIVDIEGRGPSHITAPAIHLNRSRIRDMLARSGADLDDDDPVRLSRYVRDVVAAFFRDCDAAITGANAVIASSGRIVAVENEGNVSLGASHPRLHIVITGLEKVVADEAGALAILEVLAPSATAQPLTSFTNIIADPLPGQQRHVVFVDNGRSRIAASPRYADVLRCIRCGACMNACPVYRAAGGLSYGSAYMGPIGAVLSPLLWPGEHADLPFASSLCGRCTEVCPVGIPLHRMLLDLRADAVASGKASRAARAAWKSWAFTFGGATTARIASTAARLGLRAAGAAWRDRRIPRDIRAVPRIEPVRDPAALKAPPPPAPPPPAFVPVDNTDATDLEALFRRRVADLGVQVVEAVDPAEGDRDVIAAGAIANTGSVVLTGEAAARRPLLGARRVVVRLDPATIVRHPSDAVPLLGEGEALILTGASRTADIEKQIVRGIHGSEELVIVLPGGPGPGTAVV